MVQYTVGGGCGPYDFSFSMIKDSGSPEAVDSSIITIDETSKTMTVQTMALEDVGVYQIVYTYSLNDYPTVTAASQAVALELTVLDYCTSA